MEQGGDAFDEQGGRSDDGEDDPAVDDNSFVLKVREKSGKIQKAPQL